MQSWQPDSWQRMPVSQQIRYQSSAALAEVVGKLKDLPPLVSVQEVTALKSQLAEAARGERFLLQGGDCAESFADCNADMIRQKVRILLQMSLVLVSGLKKPVVKVGRIAGQYAKPRSDAQETRANQTLPSYRGDLVNHVNFSEASRTPDPERLLKGYSYASLTLNYIRSLLEDDWQAWLVAPAGKQDPRVTDLLGKLQSSMELLPLFSAGSANARKLELFTSHEALHLYYEQALTRRGPDQRWYNLSTHFPWVGMRTTNPRSAHIEYIRGIANPIALKVSPGMNAEQLLRIADIVDPEQEPGRLTLIHRFGVNEISRCLPPLIRAMQDAGRTPLWCCDPMHGNTRLTSRGVKTRLIPEILGELRHAVTIHQGLGSHLGGVHFELTGEQVTECIGGRLGLTEADLDRAYKSLVDPRLNAGQALEMAQTLAAMHQSGNSEFVTAPRPHLG